MKGEGYIYFWRIQDGAGLIRICGGQFSGLNVAFPLEDCDKPLRKKLGESNINKKRQCPPPDDALLVTFDLTIVEGDMQATNVSEA
jgi:hypothetical protein